MMLAMSSSLMVVVMVAVAAGAPADSTPQPCCFEREFTAVLGELGGTNENGHSSSLQGSVQLGFDYYRQRQGSISTLQQPDGSYKTTYVLSDYNTRTIYTASQGGSCVAGRMPDTDHLYPPCVPDDANYTGPLMLGYGVETLRVNTWEFTLPAVGYRVRLAVTEDCVPMAQSLYGKSGEADMQLTYFFTAYHPGIEDLAALNPPDNCPMAPANDTEVQVGRRSFRLF